MAIIITNGKADSMVRQLAKLEGIEVREADARRRSTETPLQTAARIRAELGIELTDNARRLLPRAVYDEMSGKR